MKLELERYLIKTLPQAASGEEWDLGIILGSKCAIERILEQKALRRLRLWLKSKQGLPEIPKIMVRGHDSVS